MTDNTSAASTDLLADARNFLASRPDLTQAHLAQYTTLSPSTVRTFLSGVQPAGGILRAELGRVLSQARSGKILQPGNSGSVILTDAQNSRAKKVRKVGTFYQTGTVRKIGEVLDYCVENCTIGVITADFGVGKTEAVRAWRRQTKAESLIFEFDEFTAANKVETLRMVCDSLGIESRIATQNAGSAFRALCEWLRENPCLLIFDQCEMIRPRVCQVLRQIWDRTSDAGVGMVMLAAPIMLSRMMAGNVPDMGALTSRVGVWAPLSGMTRTEMASIVKREGFTEVDDAAFSLWAKAVNGSMRRLLRSVDLLKAKHPGKRITEKTIAGVAGHLFGMSIEGGGL